MRKCLMAFLIILFIVTLPSFFFVINFCHIFTPEYIKKEIVSSGVIEELSNNLPEQLKKGLNEDASLNEEVILKGISSISNKEIKSALEQNFNNNIEILSDSKAKEIVLDISALTRNIPPEAMQAMKESGQGELKERYVYPIPLEIRIYRLASANLTMFKLIGYSLFGLLLLLIALVSHGWQTKFRSLSLALLLPALIILVPFSALRFIPFNLPSLANVPKVLSEISTDLFNTVKIDISNLFLIEGAVLLMISIALFIFSFFFSSKNTIDSIKASSVS